MMIRETRNKQIPSENVVGCLQMRSLIIELIGCSSLARSAGDVNIACVVILSILLLFALAQMIGGAGQFRYHAGEVDIAQ